MHATAALTCVRTNGEHRITRLRSEGQLVLRPTAPKGFEPWVNGSAGAARVSLSAGAAGPLGGDRLRLEVRVGAGAVLVLNEISATLALPGTTGAPSFLTVQVEVGPDATLIWRPEPVIAARGCDHRQDIRVALAESSRFHLREELIVGRSNESPGDIRQRLRVERNGRALLDQQLCLGPRSPGWDGPAVVGGAKAVGSLVVVDPGSAIGRGRSDLLAASGTSVGIADDAVLATAAARDSLALSRTLDDALRRLGDPWAPPQTTGPVWAR